MKSVLISIRPEWCEKIARGKKTIDVRKTRPKIDTPFKCYIYCTRINPKWKNIFWVDETHNDNDEPYLANGKIIGEFICDRIDVIEVSSEAFNRYAKESCLTPNDFVKYCNGQDLYGWHISDLVIYDEFKELGEFITGKSVHTFDAKGNLCYTGLKRPPQSWCYVEE